MTSAVVFAIWLSFQQPLLLLLLLLHAQAGSMLFKADKLNPNSICDQYPSLCRTQLVQGQPWMGGVERHQQQQSASLPATSDRIMVRALQPAFGIGKNKLRSMLKTPFNVPLDEQMGPAAAISPTKPISVALPRTTSLDYMMMQLYLSSKLENERRRRERYFAKKFCKECF
ncbi:hypothetical protein T4E_4022 [Trichinella pseudospiralis]|uniref:Uncharacterized protein n=1 Tax=Trichinella pseudospiralis TaxID=6337 RepID=A0A0V0YPB9_TRIPS|nr:hypothetical protein T4E_4022 [Trichinella pseudospiralis]